MAFYTYGYCRLTVKTEDDKTILNDSIVVK